MTQERTLSIIKPDAVAEGHIGEIIALYEARGLRVVRIRETDLTQEQASDFYAEHKGKSFFEGLVSYMTSGTCLPISLTGEDAIARVREINGHTDPQQAAPGTVRALFGKPEGRNAVHGSDSATSAEREIRFFFGE